jgi:prophage regulatory protein
MSENILRFKQACTKIGFSRSGLYTAIREGRFVKPRQLGPRTIGFLESEVDAWLRNRPVADPTVHHIGHVGHVAKKRRKAQRDASCTARTA